MGIMYHSTRGEAKAYTASQAILQGLAPDGGLFVPDSIPALPKSLKEFAAMDYHGVALEILAAFLTDFTRDELEDCVQKAYDSKFDTPEIAPLVRKSDAYYLELYHGATIAFKDMALSILPHLCVKAAKKNNEHREIVILTATSGDTGKAAMAGFADVPGTRIFVFYPDGGVSPIQKLQMVTQKGANVRVAAIRGNFDDAQTGVKKLFSDRELCDEISRRGYVFSSANSINIGRLVPQVAYYVWAYSRLLARGEITEGEKINFTVPTGNFGNILAGYYAKCMGLPVSRLICASNENKVLFDFFTTGTYDRNRPFILTSSPSMDILVSSNLERLIYKACGDDAEQTAKFMKELAEDGKYTVTDGMKKNLADFRGGYATQEETSQRIHDEFVSDHYVLDPHTAVASAVYRKYRETTGDPAKTVIVSTASPFKFVRSVVPAVDPEDAARDEGRDFELIADLERVSGVRRPAAVRELENAPVLHRLVISRDQMKDAVLDFLK
ncbi:MAG: threonine synthase [Lachnospiraceae bacterium]|jgi:threonine synthase